MSIAIITGASGGIGKEFAKGLFRSYGVKDFWFVARNEKKLLALIEEMKEISDDFSARIIPLDLSSDEGIDELCRIVEDEKPKIKYLINSAGFGKFGRFDEISSTDVRNMINLNDKALVLITHACIPYMESGGRIVELGSGSCFTPLPNFNVYAASKSFVLHYTKALNFELRKYGVRATCFCPGWVETEFFDTAIESGVSMPKKNKIKPLLNAEKVTRGCLKAVAKGKAMYVTGYYTKLQHVLFKLVPDPILTRIWLGMQNRKN